MNRRTLKRIVIAVVVFLTGYGLLGVSFVLFAHESVWFDLYKSLVSVVVAVPLAFLAYAFQQRVSYVAALRDVLKQVIPAVQGAIHYTQTAGKSRAEFLVVKNDLSMAIELLRGVFKNVGESRSARGLYPFENLKEIFQVISRLGCEESFGKEFPPEEARRCIIELWREMHQALLLENDREEPVFPLSKYIDNRRSIADELFARDKQRDIEPSQEKKADQS